MLGGASRCCAWAAPRPTTRWTPPTQRASTSPTCCCGCCERRRLCTYWLACRRPCKLHERMPEVSQSTAGVVASAAARLQQHQNFSCATYKIGTAACTCLSLLGWTDACQRAMAAAHELAAAVECSNFSWRATFRRCRLNVYACLNSSGCLKPFLNAPAKFCDRRLLSRPGGGGRAPHAAHSVSGCSSCRGSAASRAARSTTCGSGRRPGVDGQRVSCPVLAGDLQACSGSFVICLNEFPVNLMPALLCTQVRRKRQRGGCRRRQLCRRPQPPRIRCAARVACGAYRMCAVANIQAFSSKLRPG